MKIAYSLGSLGRGGTETLLLDVFRNAKNADFDFIGIYRKVGFNSLKSEFEATEQKLFRLSPKFPFDLLFLYKLRKLLQKEKVNIVHAQQSLDAFYAWLACLGTGIRVVQTFHGYDSLDLNKKYKFLDFVARITDKNFFVSRSQRDFYIKKYGWKPQKQVTVYNGISFDKLDGEFEKPDFLCHTSLDAVSGQTLNDKSRLKLAMVGNFVPVRAQNCLCRFLKLLKEKNIDFDFYFVGLKIEEFANLYDDCVQYCTENSLNSSVHFLGGRNDVPAILKNIDAFLYSTSHDTFGIAVIEAIASEIPVFVNDWSVMTEITNNGEYATIYKTQDENDLLNKFMLFLQQKETYLQKLQDASAKVRDKFSIETHLQNLKKEYDSIC